MQTVTSLHDAYQIFQPYDPNRDSETVTIFNGCGLQFLHWDRALKMFRVDGPNRAAFAGWMIDTMGRGRPTHNPQAVGNQEYLQ